jgi:tetratricopeptide (TPR) repeat protein
MANKFVIFLMVAVFSSVFQTTLSAADTQKGVELYQSHKYSEAASELKQAVANNPNDVRARYYLGLSLLEQQQYQDAQAQFDAAQREITTGSNPPLDQVKIGLARAQMEQKNYVGASASLDEARQLNPKNADVFVYRGKLAYLQGNYGEAVKQLEQAIAMDPTNAYAHYYAGMAYSKTGRPDKMVNEFQMFLKLAPDAPEAAKVRSLLRAVR